jgi:hypothetical protein
MWGFELALELQLCRQMLQIRRSVDRGLVIITLTGRIEEEQLSELEMLLKSEDGSIVLDLADVRLVHREAVRFLSKCEDGGIELRNCPSYVREWIEKGRGQQHEP